MTRSTHWRLPTMLWRLRSSAETSTSTPRTSLVTRARATAATVLGIGIALGVLSLLVLQRYVAEVDDQERTMREVKVEEFPQKDGSLILEVFCCQHRGGGYE